MNKMYLILTMTLIIVFLSICLIFAQQIIQPAGIYVDEIRNSDGTMTFTVRTIAYGGTYSPRNVGAIWITNSSNQFVKTIKVWAAEYRSKLVKWIASSGNNTTGAITSATITSHQLHSVTWNGKNYSNATIPDGNYNVNIEYTESNSTISNPGKYKVVTFNNGTTPIDNVPASDSYFTDMHLVWTPTPPANGTISGTVINSNNLNISGAVVSTGTNSATTNASGFYTISIQPGTYNLTCSATNYQPQTQSNVAVTSNVTTTVNFNMGNPDDGIIGGTITDAQNNPISGAIISSGTFNAVSNINGVYSLSLQPGTYNLTCTVTGYEPQSYSNAVVQSNQTTTVNFTLDVTAIDNQLAVYNSNILAQNYPNPFSNVTTLKYYLAKNSNVSIGIYNSKGQLLKTLIQTNKSSGWNEIKWDGTNSKGQLLPSGNYICRLQTESTTKTKTITLKH